MPLSVVAIVGRPNVGKSSMFNCLAGKRIAIVDPTAGVTRDRVSTIIEHEGRYFELIDTGGMGIVDRDDLADQVEEQISLAIQTAAVLVMAVDIRDGVRPLDRLVAERLRKQNKPVVLVANKADAAVHDTESAVFYEFGLGEPMPFSAVAKRSKGRLLDRLIELLPPQSEDEKPAETAMTLAIVGKRNAGKSTFINSLAGEPRVIVSEVPGTTRDSVDIRIEKDGLTYVVIDTAGLKKKHTLGDDIEFYSRVRAEEAIRRADVSLLMIDATLPIAMLDKHLGQFIVDSRKPVVLVINKWDLAKDQITTGDYVEYLNRELTGLKFAPVAFISAIESRNTQATLDLSRAIYKQAHTRVSTAQLNKAIAEAVRLRKPPGGRGGAPLKVYYGTQVSMDPPTLALFVNKVSEVSTDYARYLVNRFRELLPFAEVPMRLIFRQSGGDRHEIEPAGSTPRGRRRRKAI